MAGKQHWILIADDDPEDQEMVCEVIKQLDAHVKIEAVSNGRQALWHVTDSTQNEPPVLIILDYKMPILNGAEVLEALARDERFASIPKLVWSSYYHEEDVRRCLKAGAREYF